MAEIDSDSILESFMNGPRVMRALCKVSPRRYKLWNIVRCAVYCSFSVTCAKFSTECKTLVPSEKNVKPVRDSDNRKSQTYQSFLCRLIP